MNNTQWQWPNLDSVFSTIPIPENYELGTPSKSELPSLIANLRDWYPGIVTSEESVHLDENFYLENCFLSDDKNYDKNVIPIILKYQGDIVALVTFEKNNLSRNVTSRIGAVDPKHRGSKIAFIGPALLETLGRQMKAGLIFYYATLQIPHQQAVAEKMGFTIVGIMPAFDRDLMPDGSVKRVYEAIYAKVLCGISDIDIPRPEALTPNTLELYNRIFGKTKLENA